MYWSRDPARLLAEYKVMVFGSTTASFEIPRLLNPRRFNRKLKNVSLINKVATQFFGKITKPNIISKTNNELKGAVSMLYQGVFKRLPNNPLNGE